LAAHLREGCQYCTYRMFKTAKLLYLKTAQNMA
jgi:hypothetical protein